MDPYETQKETAGIWATIVWLASGLFLYMTTEGASLLSWSALLFFLVGMFAAAVIFGVAFYLLQRGVAKAVVKMVKAPSSGTATVISASGLALLVVETVIIYLTARWVLQAIT
jgi:hypothetical protein